MALRSLLILLVAVAAVYVTTTYKQLNIYACYNGLCGSGSCTPFYSFNQSKCSLTPGNNNNNNNNNGNNSNNNNNNNQYIKVTCTASTALCISEEVYGFTSKGCFEPVAQTQQRRVGVCQPDAFGTYGIIASTTTAATSITYDFKCDSACKTCNKSVTVPLNTCLNFYNLTYINVRSIYTCGAIVDYQMYSDSACTKAQTGQSGEFIAGLTCNTPPNGGGNNNGNNNNNNGLGWVLDCV